MSQPLVDIVGVDKVYTRKAHVVPVLKQVHLQLEQGCFLSIMGASGSGKSTLLNIIGCLDQPTGGAYCLDGVDVRSASDDELSNLRSRCLGFVFQNFNLIPNLTVTENVELPFLYRSDDTAHIRQWVTQAITQVGLHHRRGHKPAELSGGEMQRVAIARALAVQPKLILADEPTGNLDRRTGAEIMAIFNQLHRDGATIILVTHDPDIAAYADQKVTLDDGLLKTQRSGEC